MAVRQSDGWSLQIEKFASTAKFLDATREFLELREAENNLLLGMLERQVRESLGDYPLMLNVVDGGQTVLVCVLVSETLFLSSGPEAATESVVKAVADAGCELRAIVGPATSCEAFVANWYRVTNSRCVQTVSDILYKLTSVKSVGATVGSVRPMSTDDVDLVAKWQIGFEKEAMTQELSLDKALEKANKRVVDQDTYIWEVESQAVSMAAFARPTANGIAINSVYTPVGFRRNGYAKFLVAKMSTIALTKLQKSFCVLYADAANATSNKIYKAIGYEELVFNKIYQCD
jgi:predicted GNAT family acetyltransferase